MKATHLASQRGRQTAYSPRAIRATLRPSILIPQHLVETPPRRCLKCGNAALREGVRSASCLICGMDYWW